jgi:hypothetical protein
MWALRVGYAWLSLASKLSPQSASIADVRQNQRSAADTFWEVLVGCEFSLYQDF